MKFKITYMVQGMIFEAIAYGETDAFDYARAIINANKIMYPNQQEALDNYFRMIAELSVGIVSAIHSGDGSFSIEKVDEGVK